MTSKNELKPFLMVIFLGIYFRFVFYITKKVIICFSLKRKALSSFCIFISMLIA